MITPIDYSETSPKRLIQLYRDKPNFNALIEVYADKAQEIEDTAFQMLLFRDVETAFGEQLDIIGRIVGQDRTLADATPFVFFGYKDGISPPPVNVGGYGDENNPALGARYHSEDEEIGSDVELADPEYRLFIKARILKNHTRGTRNEIIAAIQLLSETTQFTLTTGIMVLNLNFTPGSVNLTTLNLLENFDLLPRPAGVLMNVTSV
jgi:hypothetical protein